MKRFAIVAVLLVFESAWLVGAQDQSSDTGRETASFIPVTWERLVNAAEEPQNWLM